MGEWVGAGVWVGVVGDVGVVVNIPYYLRVSILHKKSFYNFGTISKNNLPCKHAR